MAPSERHEAPAPSVVSGGEAVVGALRALGVEHIFGIVSIHNVPIFEALDRLGGITHISCRHEQGAVHAADGYARATGRLGVAIGSTGPGTSNAMTGLFEANFASSPVLLVTGQTPLSLYGKGRGYLHEHEHQVEMLRSVAPYVESVRTRSDIAPTILRVARSTLRGRPRPGAVEIPIDLQESMAVEPVPLFEYPPLEEPSDVSIARAAEILNGSTRPMIWAGGGATSAEASAALTEIAHRLSAPVVNTTNGRGSIAWDDPHRIGTVTDLPSAWELLRDSDALLAVGTRFQASATGDWRAPVPEQLIHIDVDPLVLGLNYCPKVAIRGDAARSLERLLARLDPEHIDSTFMDKARSIRARVEKQLWSEMGPEYELMMGALARALPPSTVVCADTTIANLIAGRRLLPVSGPRSAIAATSGAIGPGLPTALGAAIGSGRPTILIQGDGGLMLSLGELATVAENGVALVILVFNDAGYGALRMVEARAYGRQFATDLVTPDFVQLARSMGMSGTRVEHAADLGKAFEEAIRQSGPCLIDIDLTKMPTTSPVAWWERFTAARP